MIEAHILPHFIMLGITDRGYLSFRDRMAEHHFRRLLEHNLPN